MKLRQQFKGAYLGKIIVVYFSVCRSLESREKNKKTKHSSFSPHFLFLLVNIFPSSPTHTIELWPRLNRRKELISHDFWRPSWIYATDKIQAHPRWLPNFSWKAPMHILGVLLWPDIMKPLGRVVQGFMKSIHGGKVRNLIGMNISWISCNY